MNAIFLTQAGSLTPFFAVMEGLRAKGRLERAGFLVADHKYFDRFAAIHPPVLSQPVVKEWELVERARHGTPDLPKLRDAERRLGEPTLWDALVSDRRVILGPNCTLTQDYRRRFSHDRMLRLAEEGIEAIERLFDSVKPDLVVSFVCVTFAEYLAHRIATARGIRIANVRPTRIENFITCGPGVFEPSATIAEAYAADRRDRIEDDAKAYARVFLSRAREGRTRYEGVIPASRAPHRAKTERVPLIDRTAAWVREAWSYRIGPYHRDNHALDPVKVLAYKRVINPIRAGRVHRALAPDYRTAASLDTFPYLFFPLHTEPEVTLLVQSRAFLNQIEAVRNIALNLPVGLSVVVKEHPASVGKRPLGYYRKLLDIPNVRLADPALTSAALIEKASLVATIAGSIGFEALIQGKPALTLGRTPFQILPETMVRRVTDMTEVGSAIRDLLDNHRHDEAALEAYVAATIRHSARVNLYSGLLGREGVYVPDDGEPAADLENLMSLIERSASWSQA